MSDLPVPSRPVEFYARIVRDRAHRRDLQEAAMKLAAACSNGHTPEELQAETAGLWRLGRYLETTSQKMCEPTSDILRQALMEINMPAERRLRTFFPAFDNATRGMVRGEVLSIIARPAVGKSALACQIAINMAVANRPVAFFSLEMPRVQCAIRLLQATVGYTEKEAEQAIAADLTGLSTLSAARLEAVRQRVAILDPGRGTMSSFEAGLEEAERVLGERPALVVVDHLGLLRIGVRAKSAYERASEAAVEMKRFAKAADVALLMIVQAHRFMDPDMSEGAKEIGLDAARDSGQIEENSDFMLTMWRPELSKKLDALQRQAVQGILEVSLVKNRRGPRRRFDLRFLPECLQILDPDAPPDRTWRDRAD